MLAQIEPGQDPIGVMNITTLLENALMSCGMRNRVENLQMLLPEEQTELLNYSETDVIKTYK